MYCTFSKFPIKNSGGLNKFFLLFVPFIINSWTSVNNIKIIVEIFNFHNDAKNLLYAPRMYHKLACYLNSCLPIFIAS